MRDMPGRSPRAEYRPERANSSTVSRQAKSNSSSVAAACARSCQTPVSRPAFSHSAVRIAM